MRQRTSPSLAQRARRTSRAKDFGGEGPEVHSTLQGCSGQDTQHEAPLTGRRPKHPIELAIPTAFIMGLPKLRDPGRGKSPSRSTNPQLWCREQRCQWRRSPQVHNSTPIMAGATTGISNKLKAGTLYSGQMAVQKYLTWECKLKEGR